MTATSGAVRTARRHGHVATLDVGPQRLAFTLRHVPWRPAALLPAPSVLVWGVGFPAGGLLAVLDALRLVGEEGSSPWAAAVGGTLFVLLWFVRLRFILSLALVALCGTETCIADGSAVLVGRSHLFGAQERRFDSGGRVAVLSTYPRSLLLRWHEAGDWRPFGTVGALRVVLPSGDWDFRFGLSMNDATSRALLLDLGGVVDPVRGTVEIPLAPAGEGGAGAPIPPPRLDPSAARD